MHLASIVVDCLPEWRTGDMGGILVEGWSRQGVEATLRLRGIPDHQHQDYWPILGYLERGLRDMRYRARKDKEA